MACVRPLARGCGKYIRCSMRKNLRGSMAREDIYKVGRALSPNLSRTRRRAQRDCLSETTPTNSMLYFSA